jgi:hypothetical protein
MHPKMRIDHLGYVLVAAVRYQLPRMTYGSGIVVDAVCAAWPSLAAGERAVILRDVREALERDNAGMDCDRREWQRLLALADLPAVNPHAAWCQSRAGLHFGKLPCNCPAARAEQASAAAPTGRP